MHQWCHYPSAAWNPALAAIPWCVRACLSCPCITIPWLLCLLQRPTAGRYADTMRFEDPLVRLEGLGGYQLNLTMLRTLFDIDFKVMGVRVTGSDELTAR